MRFRALTIAAVCFALFCQREHTLSGPVSVKRTQANAAPEVLPFINDDYKGALAQAKQRKVPLFVEAWAPW